jgi:multimeric flavodoxin WrbA
MGQTITLYHTDTNYDTFLSKIIQEIKSITTTNGCTLNTLDISKLQIQPCQGCFHCWTKTPGSCILNDDGNTVAHEFINSDTVILLSCISFGGYQSQLKSAIDRIIPLVLPFFRKYHGETHHTKRYETYPNLISIGILKNPNEKKEGLFKRLLERNALNFTPPKTAQCIINEQDTEYKEKLSKTLLKVVGSE